MYTFPAGKLIIDPVEYTRKITVDLRKFTTRIR